MILRIFNDDGSSSEIIGYVMRLDEYKRWINKDIRGGGFRLSLQAHLISDDILDDFG
jgi:hypothetical protein